MKGIGQVPMSMGEGGVGYTTAEQGRNLTELFNMGVARTAGSNRPGIYYNRQVNFGGAERGT